MSTKTLRKRIALVAVSALGAGLLSVTVVPSANAALSAVSITVGANGATSTSSQGILAGSTGAALTGTTKTLTMTANGQLAVSTTGTGGGSGDTSRLSVSGGTIVSAASGSVSTLAASQTSVTTGGNADFTTVIVKPTAVGTPLVLTSSYSNDGSTYTTSAVVTVSVVASSIINVFDAGNSFFSALTAAGSSTSNADATWTATSGSTATAPATKVKNGNAGYMGFTLKDATGTNLSSPVVTGTATGGCVVNTSDSKGTVATVVSSSAGSYFRIDKPTTNVPAVCTLTITVNGATVATRTFTFHGQLAKISIAATGIARVSATASDNTQVFYFDALDSAGNSLDGISISADSTYYNSALQSVTISGSSAPFGLVADDNAVTGIVCVAKGTYKMKLKGTAADTSTIKSDEFSIPCAGGAVNYTATLDKSSYVPGDVATLTITAKDSGGNLTYDALALGSTTYPVSIAGSNMTAVSAPTNADYFVSGVKKYKFVVGSTEGSYQLSVDLPKFNSSTYNQAALTVPYTIKASSASVTNAEVLAAIVKLIASINKQIAALQKALTKKK